MTDDEEKWIREVLDALTAARAENAALREIAQAVANLGVAVNPGDDMVRDFSEWCAWCGATIAEGNSLAEPHDATCPVTRARALLAKEVG